MTEPNSRRGKSPAGDPSRVIGYLRVSTSEQAASGAGLAAQEAAIRAEVERRGWQLVDVLVDAGASGKTMRERDRPKLAEALARVRSGEAGTLIVAKLDRLSRSLLDFAGLMANAQRERWGIVALDPAVDMTTPSGQLVANVMASVAEWERQIIAQRTRESLAQRAAAGVRIGRPPTLPGRVVARVVRERVAGSSLGAIAAGLNRDQVPTAHGGARWYPSTVARVLASHPARELAA